MYDPNPGDTGRTLPVPLLPVPPDLPALASPRAGSGRATENGEGTPSTAETGTDDDVWKLEHLKMLQIEVQGLLHNEASAVGDTPTALTGKLHGALVLLHSEATSVFNLAESRQRNIVELEAENARLSGCCTRQAAETTLLVAELRAASCGGGSLPLAQQNRRFGQRANSIETHADLPADVVVRDRRADVRDVPRLQQDTASRRAQTSSSTADCGRLQTEVKALKSELVARNTRLSKSEAASRNEIRKLEVRTDDRVEVLELRFAEACALNAELVEADQVHRRDRLRQTPCMSDASLPAASLEADHSRIGCSLSASNDIAHDIRITESDSLRCLRTQEVEALQREQIAAAKAEYYAECRVAATLRAGVTGPCSSGCGIWIGTKSHNDDQPDQTMVRGQMPDYACEINQWEQISAAEAEFRAECRSAAEMLPELLAASQSASMVPCATVTAPCQTRAMTPPPSYRSPRGPVARQNASPPRRTASPIRSGKGGPCVAASSSSGGAGSLRPRTTYGTVAISAGVGGGQIRPGVQTRARGAAVPALPGSACSSVPPSPKTTTRSTILRTACKATASRPAPVISPAAALAPVSPPLPEAPTLWPLASFSVDTATAMPNALVASSTTSVASMHSWRGGASGTSSQHADLGVETFPGSNGDQAMSHSSQPPSLADVSQPGDECPPVVEVEGSAITSLATTIPAILAGTPNGAGLRHPTSLFVDSPHGCGSAVTPPEPAAWRGKEDLFDRLRHESAALKAAEGHQNIGRC